MASALHASYLDRWGRHDPAGREEAISPREEAERLRTRRRNPAA